MTPEEKPMSGTHSVTSGTQGARGALLVMLAGVVWSFAGLLAKWVPWSAWSIIGGRALVAVLFFGLARRSFVPRFSGGVWLGALGVMLTSSLFILANKLTSAANAIVLQYAMPIVVIFASWLFYRQKPGRIDLLASAIALAGILLCFLGGLGRGSLPGDLVALSTAFTFALVFFAARFPDTDPMDYTYLGTLLNCLFLLYVPFDPQFSLGASGLVGILLMGLCLGGGYILFSAGMRTRVHPVTASIVANVEPVLNPLWAFLFLRENPGTPSLLGAALVILSVSVYALLKGRSRQAAE